MQKTTDMNKIVSYKSNSENTIQKLPIETSSNSSEKKHLMKKKVFLIFFKN